MKNGGEFSCFTKKPTPAFARIFVTQEPATILIFIFRRRSYRFFRERSGRSLTEKSIFFSAGDVCVVFPYQFHEYEDIGETRTVVIVLSPEEFSEFDAVFHSKLPKSPVVKDETGALRALSLRLAECVSGETSEKDGAPVPPPMQDGLASYRSALAKGYGLLLLGALLPSVEFAEINRMEIPALQKILHYCVENFTRELSLDVLAKELHMNKHFISKLINGALSMSFTGYLNMIRIYAAQEKMERCEKTMNISEIAYSCGFSSIRSFNRNFLRLTGMSPPITSSGITPLKIAETAAFYPASAPNLE